MDKAGHRKPRRFAEHNQDPPKPAAIEARPVTRDQQSWSAIPVRPGLIREMLAGGFATIGKPG